MRIMFALCLFLLTQQVYSEEPSNYFVLVGSLVTIHERQMSTATTIEVFNDEQLCLAAGVIWAKGSKIKTIWAHRMITQGQESPPLVEALFECTGWAKK